MVMEKVHTLLREHQMLRRGDTVLAAVSGGGDSMCMLHLLWREGERWGIRLEAATFDHGIRPESAEDAAFVQSWCREHGIPCHMGREDAPRYAREHQLGLEEGARALRYQFLQSTAQAIGAGKIATAHNADDNAETVLFHLVRGTGLKGLGGIPPVRENLIRPLLTTSREEIERYLAHWEVPHVEDATNADLAYSRNYLRHKVLPLLKAQNPSLLEGMSRSARSLRQDSSCLESQAAELAAEARQQGGGLAFSVRRLRQLPQALSNRVVQQLAQRVSPGVVLSSLQRERVLALCEGGNPSALCPLSGGLTACRVYDQVLFTMEQPGEGFPPMTLEPGQTVAVGGRELSCQWAFCPQGKFNQPDVFYIQAKGALLLRPRRTGDAITLPGRDRKTVKKLFIDSKVPRGWREQIAVFEIEGQVAALDGFGTDRAFLPEPGEQCYRISGRETDPTVKTNKNREDAYHGDGK